MQHLRLIRKEMGITQAQLAGILGIQRSQLAQAECGLRFLPMKANSRLFLIESFLNNLVLTQKDNTVKNLQQWQLQLQQCQQKIRQNNQILTAMQLQEKQCLQCLLVIERLQQEQPNDTATAKVALWISSIQVVQQEQLKLSGTGIQQIIACETTALEQMEQYIYSQLEHT